MPNPLSRLPSLTVNPNSTPQFQHRSPLAPLMSWLISPTPYEDATSYNNFYEFSQDKEGVLPMAGSLKYAQDVENSGVAAADDCDLEDTLKRFPSEERV